MYPHSANRRKLPDRGMLPLNIQVYLADPTHRKEATCKNLFKHAKSSKRSVNTQGLTLSKCERIQVNFGAYIKIYCHLPISNFVENSDCIYLHHFNDHSKCGRWCPFSSNLPVDERRAQSNETMKKYCYTVKNKEMLWIVIKLISPYLIKQSL